MAFWNQTYLNKLRQNVMRSIVKCRYQIGTTWYVGVINTKSIVDENVVIIVACTELPTGNQTINSVQLIDDNGDVAAEQGESISKTGTQGILIKFELPIKEV